VPGELDLQWFAEQPVTRLDGVGDKKAEALGKLGIETLFDLLTYYPRRYLDRTRQIRIDDIVLGEEAIVLATVRSISSVPGRGRGRGRVEGEITDGTGHLRVTFFNQPWRERQLPAGTEAVFVGKVDAYRGRRQMTNPDVDLIGDRTGRIVPIYPQSGKAKVNTWEIAAWIGEMLRKAFQIDGARGLVDPLPERWLDRWDFVDRQAATQSIHEPESMVEKDAARRRLVFDELLRVQLALVLRKAAIERSEAGIAHSVPGDLMRRFWEKLPFELTGDQARTIDEIRRDMARAVPMHRLLQGDVGAGKTVVAVSAMLLAVEGGHQAALMAPTEVLAEQHAVLVRSLLEEFTIDDEAALFARSLSVASLSNKTPPSVRKRILAELASGQIDIVIGTHALIQEAVDFSSLGLAVIDEQHRFGVEQRAALREKAPGEVVPDVLVMTATPIPRTAAMTVYGDLDVSILAEKPPGRTKVETVWARQETDEADAWERVRAEVAAGRQAYVVCPLIEESDKLEVASAEETHERLTTAELDGLSVGLLHGRLGSADKEQTMELFRRGRFDVLVATTVIEVGVDVPNATVMVILDADRFGIAQLHQLRGRVGRQAGVASYCYLVAPTTVDEDNERLAAMVRTEDGFELAEVDLEIRGEGSIMGERQKGRSDLKLASLRRDKQWVERAREAAIELVGAGLSETMVDEISLFLDPDEADFLLKG
jgi:ATP-dependent DNA helicase RecG